MDVQKINQSSLGFLYQILGPIWMDEVKINAYAEQMLVV